MGSEHCNTPSADPGGSRGGGGGGGDRGFRHPWKILSLEILVLTYLEKQLDPRCSIASRGRSVPL